MRKTPEPSSHENFPTPIETVMHLQSIPSPAMAICNAAGEAGKTPVCPDTKVFIHGRERERDSTSILQMA